MQFLANANIPMASVNVLRRAGFSVSAIVEEAPGINDRVILAKAAAENLVILTFDRDYGELIFRKKLPLPAGLVYFRFAPATPEAAAQKLLSVMNNDRIDLMGKFTIIEKDRVRQRPL